MSNSQFRALESRSAHHNASESKTDDLLIAAIASFQSLARPTRHDIQLFEDLALPLLTAASEMTMKQAARDLADIKTAPRKLILALAHQPLQISTPILVRSTVLTAADLIDIIGKNGIEHARAIARRPTDDAILQSLLQSFADPAIDRAIALRNQIVKASIADLEEHSSKNTTLDQVGILRDQLSYMLTNIETDTPDESRSHLANINKLSLADQLLDSALLIDPHFFQTTLADALGVSFERARNIIGEWPSSQLPVALMALGLSAQDCYLILTAALGTITGTRDSLRDFVHIYRSTDRNSAMQIVRKWKAEDMSEALRDKLRDLAQAPINEVAEPSTDVHTVAERKIAL